MRYLVVIAILCMTVVCSAEEVKNFTPIQKQTLENKILQMKVAENSAKEFVDYLAAEYGVKDDTWQIAKDNSGFVKKEVPKETQKAEAPK